MGVIFLLYENATIFNFNRGKIKMPPFLHVHLVNKFSETRIENARLQSIAELDKIFCVQSQSLAACNPYNTTFYTRIRVHAHREAQYWKDASFTTSFPGSLIFPPKRERRDPSLLSRLGGKMRDPGSLSSRFR